MFRYVNKLKEYSLVIKVLSCVSACCLMIIFILLYLNHNLTESRLVRIQSADGFSTVLDSTEISKGYVYSFGLNVIQDLYTWPTNGNEDFLKTIEDSKKVVTPSCFNFLLNQYADKRKAGEMQDRIRTQMVSSEYELDLEKQVQKISKDTWHVAYPMHLIERTDKGTELKDSLTIWHAIVTTYGVDNRQNPYGVSFNCFYKSTRTVR